MKQGIWHKLFPHLIATGIFLIIAVIYCKPVLEGKVVNQHDVLGWKGMAQQSIEYKEKNGRFPLWTNSLFSGMPAYTVSMDADHPVSVGYFYYVLTLGLPKPISFFFLACICFYFLCQVLRINPWISIMAALAFAYSTYDPIIISVGHNTKMDAIGLMPAVIASLLLIFQNRYLWGAALLSIFFGLQVGTQHLQIVYYTGIICGIIVLTYFIFQWKEKQIKNSLLKIGTAAFAALVGFMTFAVSMLPLQEYSKETMRGGRSELTAGSSTQSKTKGGLDKDYAFRWSYGIGETITLAVPGAYGGSNGGKEHKGNTKFTEKLAEVGVPEDQALQMVNQYSYWGEQPFTAGPVYIGAVIFFLFILGLIVINNWHRWWLIAASLIGILLAWGNHFAAFNYFLFDYLPLYNKFRTPSMSLVVNQLTFPLTAALGLNYFLTANLSLQEIWKKFRTTIYVTAGVLAVVLLFYFTADYKGTNDNSIRENFTASMLGANAAQATPQMQQQAQSFSQSLMSALQDDRKSLFGGDLLRSILFIAIAGLLLWAFTKNKLKPLSVIIGLLILTTLDLLPVGKRYLNDDNYVDAETFETSIYPTEADKQILADPNRPFRVFDQTEDPFNSSRASYFHNSIGGYHPAKLGLYQDLIEHQIAKGNIQVLNMLNTKYVIAGNGSQTIAQTNTGAFGPAWLVKGIRYVKNADEEMAALNNTSLRDTAIVQQHFSKSIKNNTGFDSSAVIRVTKYNNDVINYEFKSASDGFVVLSEIYYPLGWNAYIDGKKTEYVKANYALRGLYVPAGNHTIEFRFEPTSYKLGNTITLIASLIAFTLLIAAIVFDYRAKKMKTAKA